MQNHFDRIMRLIGNKEARVGVIGLGYTGLPLLLRFCEEGFTVTGFDVDRGKIQALNRGRSYIKHIPSEKISPFRKGGKKLFEATADFSRLKDVHVAVICVPTPLSDKREPDMSFVEAAGRETAKYLKPGSLVSLESTTYPGTTDELLLPLFEKKGLKAGKDVFLVFSPEREDPGRKDFTTKNTPKIVGGITKWCLKAGTALYSGVVESVIPVSSTKCAEMTKLLENIYRSVNIALVNELKTLCDRMGLDVWEVIGAAKTKPFGFQAFYPGPGLGGHCIPVDPFYLTWKAREYHFSTRFIELAGEINTNMPFFVVQKVVEALNDGGKSLKGARILVLGAAYKKNVDDLRESPSLELIKLLREKGAAVEYNDPHVPSIRLKGSGARLRSVKLTAAKLRASDCVLIATDHSAYDWGFIAGNSKLIVDTRNALAGVKGGRARVVKA